MANWLKGEARFVDEGIEHTIVLDAEVLLSVEAETGVGLNDVLAGMQGKLGIPATLLRHALLRGGGPELTRGEAANLLMANPEAGKALLAALNNSLPDEEEEPIANPPQPAKPGPKRKNGTGRSS